MKVQCQSLTPGDEQCIRNAECIVREKVIGGGFGWSGRHCKRHALSVVTTHWHHIKAGRIIEIVPL